MAQNVFESITDFPQPDRNGHVVYLDTGDGYSLIPYTVVNDEWIEGPRIYPAQNC